MRAPACSVAALLVGLGALAFSGSARAALTSSEQGQIVSYVAEGHASTAERVRALIARPDLTADESASALSAGVAPLAFTEQRAAYLHEMLYGTSSLPSRSVVAVAVTRSLTSRADAVMGRHEADLDQDPASIAELSRIFGFIDVDVANAGQPHGTAHDASAGIGASSYDDAAHALGALIASHPRWLKGDALIPAAAAPVRGQLQLAMLDMTGDTTTRRFDVSDRLGLAGPRRTSLTEMGLLLLDDGHTEAARIERLRAVLARMPGARQGVEAIALYDAKPALRARGEVVALEPTTTGGAVFGSEISVPPVEPELASLARTLAKVAVRRAFEARPDLRSQSEKDAVAAGGDPARALGIPGDSSATSAVAAAAQLLTIDAPSTVDLALARLLGGHQEAAALLSDALGALVTFAPSTTTPSPTGLTVVLGHAREPSGTITATNVRVAPAGYVTGFTLGGHAFSFARDDAGISAKRDGQPIALSMLEGVRAPVSSGTVWSGGGIVFAKMSGSPRAGVWPGGRVRIIGEGHGVDAIATAAPGDDVDVEGTFDLSGETAIVLRAVLTPAGFKGIALVLDAAANPPRVSVRAWDDAGKLTELDPPAEIGSSTTKVPVKLSVKGFKLEAKVGSTSVHADVPPSLPHGDVALAAKHGGSLESSGWNVKPAAR